MNIAFKIAKIFAGVDDDIDDDIDDIDDDFDDVDDADEIDDDVNDVAFGQRPTNANSDGYIPDGSVTLERTLSGTEDTFKVYSKGGHKYVHLGGDRFIQVDGSGTVTINGVKYDKI